MAETPNNENLTDTEGLAIIQENMVQNTEAIKKTMSSSFTPYIFGILVAILFIGGGALAIDNIFVNILSLILTFIVGTSLLIIRHFYYIRSTSSVLEYLTNGTKLKEPKTIPYLDNIITFVSPQEVYDTAVQLLPDEITYLLPSFEEYLDSDQDAEDLEEYENKATGKSSLTNAVSRFKDKNAI